MNHVARYGNSAREELLDKVPTGCRRILDVGCAQGMFLDLVLERRGEGVETWGVEPDAELALIARRRGHEVVNDRFPSAAKLPTFDVIVFADVLEHMADPVRAMNTAASMLAPGGRILASIPNSRHWELTGQLLLRGRFDYTETGLLDVTHVRHFTRATSLELFGQAGLVDVTSSPLNMSGSRKVRLLDGALRAKGELLTLQYIVWGDKPC